MRKTLEKILRTTILTTSLLISPTPSANPEFKTLEEKTHHIELKDDTGFVQSNELRTISKFDSQTQEYLFEFYSENWQGETPQEKRNIPLYAQYPGINSSEMGILIKHSPETQIREISQSQFILPEKTWIDLVPPEEATKANLAIGAGQKIWENLLEKVPLLSEANKELVKAMEEKNKRYYESRLEKSQQTQITQIPIYLPSKKILGYIPTAMKIKIKFEPSQKTDTIQFWTNPSLGTPSAYTSQGSFPIGFARKEIMQKVEIGKNKSLNQIRFLKCSSLETDSKNEIIQIKIDTEEAFEQGAQLYLTKRRIRFPFQNNSYLGPQNQKFFPTSKINTEDNKGDFYFEILSKESPPPLVAANMICDKQFKSTYELLDLGIYLTRISTELAEESEWLEKGNIFEKRFYIPLTKVPLTSITLCPKQKIPKYEDPKNKIIEFIPFSKDLYLRRKSLQ